ncbi:MAG: type II secretion system F family protein, partial [Planctomycetota bacterium]
MAEYNYRAKKDGKSLSGSISASTADDAKSELRRQGYQLLDLNKKGKGFDFSKILSMDLGGSKGSAKRARVKLVDLIVFTRQLSTMLSAGIPLLECLEILGEQTEEANFRAVIDQVVDDVRTGSDFSEALRKHPRVFTNIYVSMIKAGEASGQLDEILTRLAEYQEAAAALRAKIKAAMTYPVVSLVLIFAITVGLLVFIIPKFKDIFDSLAIELPKPTKILLATSDWMQNNAPLWIAGMIGIVIGMRLYGKTPTGRKQIDWLKLRIPVFGPLFRKVAIA